MIACKSQPDSMSLPPGTQRKFCEPGAKNSRGEFKQWLHVWGSNQHGNLAPGVYPWPFESSVIDVDLLAAHAAVTKFKNWPGNWPVFIGHWSCHHPHKLYWRLAPTLALGNGCQLPVKPCYEEQLLIPEIFIHALT